MLSIFYPDPLPKSLHLFFFQAEDGIRVLTVTGVQTCALPISWDRRGRPAASRRDEGGQGWPHKPSARALRPPPPTCPTGQHSSGSIARCCSSAASRRRPASSTAWA